jgi:sigma-B regulation protein RsbU (phosphoserine phosphatase)
MAGSWQVQVYEHEQLAYTADGSGPFELGRQSEGEEAPYSAKETGGRMRIILARLDETAFSRRHVGIEPLADNRIQLRNLSRTLPIHLQGQGEVPPNQSKEIALPVAMVMGNRRIQIDTKDATPSASQRELLAELEGSGLDAASLQMLAAATIAPGNVTALRGLIGAESPALASMQSEGLVRWVQAAMGVLHSAAGSTDFFEKAAEALVDLVRLDSGQVLVWEDGHWKTKAYRAASYARNQPERMPSQQVLRHVLKDKRTFWQVPPSGSETGSLIGVNALVAAPILNAAGEVIGALYGDRRFSRGGAAGHTISKLEAMLVELLATGVAAGLARLEHERSAQEQEKQFLKLEADLAIGRRIQLSFLPEQLLQPAGWEIAAYFQPARTVGGDFYDVFSLTERYVGLMIADVCDKGVGAALFMALCRSVLRASSQLNASRAPLGALPTAADGRHGPSGRRQTSLIMDLTLLRAVEFTNNYVTTVHEKAYMFITLLFGILEVPTGVFTYINAGHDAPVIVGPAGIKGRLAPTGPVVGLMPGSEYDLGKIVLEPGDLLFMHTDGVIDARDATGQSFTEKRLLDRLTQPAPTATATLEQLVAELRAHIGTGDQFDDITILAVRRTPAGEKPASTHNVESPPTDTHPRVERPS